MLAHSSRHYLMEVSAQNHEPNISYPITRFDAYIMNLTLTDKSLYFAVLTYSTQLLVKVLGDSSGLTKRTVRLGRGRDSITPSISFFKYGIKNIMF